MIYFNGGLVDNKIMSDKHYMSQGKLDELKAELLDRKTTVRRQIAKSLEFAKQLGDLSENFEYHDAKDRQAENEKRIMELEGMIINSELVEKTTGGDVIDIGTTFIAEKGSSEVTYQIVGSNEADPMDGKISNESPIGKAFLGARPGDGVTVDTPSGAIEYTVKSIE